jgi:hypothetical protein
MESHTVHVMLCGAVVVDVWCVPEFDITQRYGNRKYIITYLHTNSTQNSTMKQNIQDITYITIRIHTRNNKNILFTQLNRSIQNIQPYTKQQKCNQKNMKECDKPNSHISSKLHTIYSYIHVIF